MADEKMESLEELRPYVAPGVPGCPAKVMDRYIVQAVQEFLKETMLWRYQMTDFPVVAAVNTYALVGPQDTLPHRVIDGFFQAPNDATWRPLYPMTEDQANLNKGIGDYSRQFMWYQGQINWKTLTGEPRWFLHEDDPGQVRLVPEPTSDEVPGLVRLKICVYPGRKGTQIPAWILERYYRAMALGAQYLLQMMPGENWSSQGKADSSMGLYNTLKNEALGDKLKSYTKSALRVEPRYPIAR